MPSLPTVANSTMSPAFITFSSEMTSDGGKSTCRVSWPGSHRTPRCSRCTTLEPAVIIPRASTGSAPSNAFLVAASPVGPTASISEILPVRGSCVRPWCEGAGATTHSSCVSGEPQTRRSEGGQVAEHLADPGQVAHPWLGLAAGPPTHRPGGDADAAGRRLLRQPLGAEALQQPRPELLRSGLRLPLARRDDLQLDLRPVEPDVDVDGRALPAGRRQTGQLASDPTRLPGLASCRSQGALHRCHDHREDIASFAFVERESGAAGPRTV